MAELKMKLKYVMAFNKRNGCHLNGYSTGGY